MLRQSYLIFTVACALLIGTACVSDNENEPEESEEWELEEEADAPELAGTFISGHLGNYDSCSDDGYIPASSDDDEPNEGAPDPDSDGDFAAGDCAPDTDCPPLDCEDAQVTIDLQNTGTDDAQGLQIEQIELFNEEGQSRAILPHLGAYLSNGTTVFDGELAADDAIQLRIEFLGPDSPFELLGLDGAARWDSHAGLVEITFSADNHDDVLIMSTEIYGLPTVDT